MYESLFPATETDQRARLTPESKIKYLVPYNLTVNYLDLKLSQPHIYVQQVEDPIPTDMHTNLAVISSTLNLFSQRVTCPEYSLLSTL